MLEYEHCSGCYPFFNQHTISIITDKNRAACVKTTLAKFNKPVKKEWFLRDRFLTWFVDDGALEIDNNLIENAIRPGAVGKKNFLFVGHPEAGERSGVIHALLGSCRRRGINPFDYLKDLFTRLPAAKIT